MGPGAEALGLEHGQIVERRPYDLPFGERKAPDGTQLGKPPGSGRQAADIYARLLAADSASRVAAGAAGLTGLVHAADAPAWCAVTASFDSGRPNMARIYGYWLGCKDHYAADREEAEQVLATYAPLRDLVRENRALGAVPHFLDADTARAVTMRYARKLAPGSCLIISVARCDDEGLGKRLAAKYTAATWHNHSPADIGSFFDGLELVGPGVTEAQTRGPGCPNPCYAAATATCWSV